MADAPRPFSVYARHLDRHHARIVTEPSFEAAAIAYVEGAHFSTSEPNVKLLVRDLGTGHEHCFRVDFETGETTPCD